MCTTTPRQANLTRSKWDDIHQADDMRISTYAGQYAFVPLLNCPNSFPVNPTIRLQHSGESWVSGMWRTEVESDLKGVGRPPTKWRADKLLYNPATNHVNQVGLTHAEDESNPMVFNKISNPPCTLRATGWNRWHPLFHDPQANFETPFDFFIPSRDIDKYRCRTHVVPMQTFTEEKLQEERAAKNELR